MTNQEMKDISYVVNQVVRHTYAPSDSLGFFFADDVKYMIEREFWKMVKIVPPSKT